MSQRKSRGPKGGPPGSLPPGPKKDQKFNIKKKPPTKKQPKKNNVVNRLQELIAEKDERIDQLKEKINSLAMENKALKKKVENLQAAGPPKKKKATPSSSGVDSGPSRKNAAAALMAKMSKGKGGGGSGGVSTGPSQGGAAAALAAKLGGHVKNKKMAEKKAGVDSGPSQKGAAAALMASMAKKKAASAKPAPSSGGGGGGGADQYKQLFKKYEMMMKLGINVHGAVGRMRQDGCEKIAIKAFEKKHGAYADDDKGKMDAADLKKLGLKVKKEVPVGKGIKMKRLHWDPITAKTASASLWAALDESSIRYDHKHFELHFQVRQRKPAEESKSNKQAARKAGDEKICFVSKKRTQGVLIGLKSFNLNNDQLRKVLHNMDESVMTVEKLSQLLEMSPTMDEQTETEKKIMQEGTRKVSDYGTVEQFFFTLCDFYNLHQRLKLWMFKQNFREICDSLLDQYKTVGKACDKVRNNKNLKLLLTIILAFGNHMNSGTRKGQIYGFNIKILTQMTGVKSFDNTRSLLMYVYEFCDRKYPDALKVHQDLFTTLKSASSMEVEVLKVAYKRIQDNMKEIKNLIQSDEIENYDIDDRFIMVLTKFHKEMAPKMKKFNMTVGNVMVSTKRVMKKFGYGSEDEPQTIESFFKIFYQFLQDFKASKEKLIKLEKDRQKRIAKRKKAKDKSKKKDLHKKYQNKKKGALPRGPAPQQNDDDEDEPQLNKGSSLYKAFAKKKKFDDHKNGLHNKLRGHVKQRSIFVKKGGQVDQKTASSTMRRLSSMYQDTQDQVKQMEDARKKAAILKYNKFRLPDINKKNQRKWTLNVDSSKPFVIPGGGVKAPGGIRPPPGRGGGQKSPVHNNNNKPPLKIIPKKMKNGQHNNNNNNKKTKSPVPGPPSHPQPKYGGQQQQQKFQYTGGIGGAANNQSHNPQNAWQQQQQQPGYGSIPNFSYQQYQQQNPQQNQQQQNGNGYKPPQQNGNGYGMQQQKNYYNRPPPNR